jgi:hypothetical protein
MQISSAPKQRLMAILGLGAGLVQEVLKEILLGMMTRMAKTKTRGMRSTWIAHGR